MPDTSSLGKKVGTTGQWVDLPPMSGTLKEPFEIKVYEIDDVERLQRRRQEESAEVSGGSCSICSTRRLIWLNLFSGPVKVWVTVSYACSLAISSLSNVLHV